MSIVQRGDGSNRITTRRKLRGDQHAWRRAWLGAVGVVLLMGGGAAAYFLAPGSGSGSTDVSNAGAPPAVTVTVTPMGPIENNGAAAVPLSPETTATPATEQQARWGLSVPSTAKISTLTVTVAHDASGNTINQPDLSPILGCLASWYTLDGPATLYVNGVATALPAVIQPTDTVYVGQPIFLAESGTDQSACEAILVVTDPVINLTVS